MQKAIGVFPGSNLQNVCFVYFTNNISNKPIQWLNFYTPTYQKKSQGELPMNLFKLRKKNFSYSYVRNQIWKIKFNLMLLKKPCNMRINLTEFGKQNTVERIINIKTCWESEQNSFYPNVQFTESTPTREKIFLQYKH